MGRNPSGNLVTVTTFCQISLQRSDIHYSFFTELKSFIFITDLVIQTSYLNKLLHLL